MDEQDYRHKFAKLTSTTEEIIFVFRLSLKGEQSRAFYVLLYPY